MFTKIDVAKSSPSSTDNVILLGEKDCILEFCQGKFCGNVQKALELDQSVVAPIQVGATEQVQLWRGSQENTSSLTICSITSEKNRNTSILRTDSIPEVLGKNLRKNSDVLILFCAKSKEQVVPAATAIARSMPLYSRKTTNADKNVECKLDFLVADGSSVDYDALKRLVESIRLCARLVDTPTNELNTDTYIEQIDSVVSSLPNTNKQVIRGTELRDKGFGGLWGVGKAAAHLPALVILSYTPSGSSKSIALVGKGIMFDTGGLSLKDKNNICTMKSDMGGSAAILAAFENLVKSSYPHSVHALLCLAENSVDSASMRPDDIITIYSGKTVEINNTDAEGRLVLSDGVAYASKHLKPDLIIDMATLTGAQMITTGKNHAGILTKEMEFERLVYQSGQKCGEWVYPMLYAPEILKKEFASEVADMKNSVKNRANAQSSCAGHFIEDHLAESYKGKWLHVDIAGPSFKDGRATGFGPSLLVQVLKDFAQ